MLSRALDSNLPAAWATADEAYDGDRQLRRDLQRHGVGYVPAVAKSHRVTASTVDGPVRADRLTAMVSTSLQSVTGLVLPIQTERLRLRAHRPDDLDSLLDYYSDPEVARYIPWEPWSRGEAEEHLQLRIERTGLDGPDYVLGLVVEREQRVIGDVVLWPADETLERGEMGWTFHPAAAGHGYATEAVQALVGVAFGTYGMRRVIAQLDSRNAASAKLCERVGMTREAYLRQDCWVKGEWTDNIIYGLLASEWQGPRSSAVRE